MSLTPMLTIFSLTDEGNILADGQGLFVGLARADAVCLYTGRAIPAGAEAYVTRAGERDDVALLPYAGADIRRDLECLDGPEGCEGVREYRMPLSGTGKAYPRCDVHWFARLDREAQLAERYPEHPPADWSPLDAGESWYED